jgi:hypothetical protein
VTLAPPVLIDALGNPLRTDEFAGTFSNAPAVEPLSLEALAEFVRTPLPPPAFRDVRLTSALPVVGKDGMRHHWLDPDSGTLWISREAFEAIGKSSGASK